MRLFNVNGRAVFKNVSKYRIDWEKPSRSKIQFKVKQFLKEFWQSNIVYEEFPVYGSRLKVDIVNMTKRIAVEVNGAQHDSFNKFFHSNSRLKYLDSIKRDVIKAEWLEKNNFRLLEINEDEIASIDRLFFINKFNITL